MTTTEKSPQDVDRLVGARIRQARILAGISQGDVGKAIGLSFQQVQKYELGSNRVSAGRLDQIARALGRRIEWFFVDDDTVMPPPRDRDSGEQKFRYRQALELLRAFQQMPADVAARFYQLAGALAADAQHHAKELRSTSLYTAVPTTAPDPRDVPEPMDPDVIALRLHDAGDA